MSISVLGLAAQKVETLQIGTKAYVSLSALSTPAAEARGIKPWIVENLKSSLGYDPWSLTSLKSLTAIRDVEPAGSGTDNGVAVRRYTATVDLATALALNAQLGVALKKFGSALSLLPAVITVHLDLGNDGYVHRLAESFTLPSTQPVSLSLVMTMNGYNTQTGTLVAPPASDVMTLQQFKQLTGSSGLPYTA
jgi:hypothetical protein